MSKLFLACSCSFFLVFAAAACSDDSHERAAPGMDGPAAAGHEAGESGQQRGSGTADGRATEHERSPSSDDERIDEQVEDSYSGSTATEAGGPDGSGAGTGTPGGDRVVHPKEP